MAKDNSNSFNISSPLTKEPDSNKSFVKKVRSRVSGLLPSSLSKWFRNDDNNKAVVRHRDEEDDDEYYDIQPPSKRVKIPSSGTVHDILLVNSISPMTFTSNDITRNHTINSEDKQNHVRSPLPEPTAGPSGSKSRKTFTPTISVNYNSTENLLNGDKDSDSDESTSGYSSMVRIGQKDLAISTESKKVDNPLPNVKPTNLFNSSTFGGHNRSLFSERSLSPQMNSSLSSRRPSFNASTFGSPNFVDRTLSTKRIINSPFYSGRTMYGGASAYSFQQGKSNDNRMSMRNQIQVKPVNKSAASNDAALSKTARRILNALEEYTTPVSDAKKIPNPLQKRSKPEGLLSKYTGANPYLMRDKISTPSNRELQIPSVPDLLKMKLKERLQDSTVAVRQIATTSKSTLNTDEYKIRTVEEEQPPKHSNKIKNKITSTRQQKQDNNQTVEEVKLPEIALPITTLPKFDFSLPLPPSCSKPLVTVACNDPPKLPESSTPKASEHITQKQVIPTGEHMKSDSETIEYKFSNPLVLAENLVSIIAINDFKFSDPVFKQKDKTMPDISSPNKSSMPNLKPVDSSNSNSFKMPDVSFNFKSSDNSSITLKRKSQNTELGQPAAKLLSGSVEEMFSKNAKTEAPLSSLDKFKPTPGMWECSVCCIRNFPDKLKCAACETAKPKQELIRKKEEPPKLKPGFGDQFKMSVDKWECGACMVRNSSSDTKCVACTTPKPVTNKPNGPITSIPAVVNSFGDKFKAPSSTWECPTCMIRNKDESNKCVACETSRPGAAVKKDNTITSGFGDSFKKKSDEWECAVCMIRNASDKTACAACDTAKPGSSTKISLPKEKAESITSFNFGIFPSNTKIDAQGLKSILKGESPQSNKNENKNEKIETSVAPIIFGGTPTTSSATSTTSSVPTFTFGIPPKTTTANDVAPTETKPKPKDSGSELSFKPPEKLPEKTSIAPSGFTFGTTTSSSKPIVISSDKLPTINAPLPKVEETLKLPVIPSVGFTFGSSFPQPPKQFDVGKIPPSIMSSAPQKPTETVAVKPVNSTPAIGGFTFGTSMPSLKRPLNSTEVSPASNIKKDAPITSLIFNPPKPQLPPSSTDASLIKKPALPLNGNLNQVETNLFGTLTKSTAPNNSFTFSAPSQVQSSILPAASAPSNLFTFGAKTTAAPMFGNTTTTTEAPVFKFNVGQPEPQPTNNPSGFGMNTDIQAAASNVFGGANASTSIFGAPTKPMFETPVSSPAPTPAPAFGSLAAPAGFGTSNTLSEIKPFAFGARPNEEPPPSKAPAFSFGQTVKPAEPPKTSAFTFGSAVPTSVPTGGFSFNPAPAPAPNPNPAPSINFNFNATKVENPSPFQTPAPPAPSIFGTPAPVQPQPQPPPVQNGGFNFGGGASNNNVKTGFNFGATPQFNTPAAPAQGLFSFGGSNPNAAQPAVGGFNFGGNPAPNFNANVKPTFNFTGGATPTFSAQPTPDSSMVAQRKKIRAVRRTQR